MKKTIMKKTVCSVVALLCAVIMGITFAACGNNKLTMENYNKIICGTLNATTSKYEGGMTFEEVKEILGEPDDSASSTIMGATATAYTWGNEEKFIIVTFYNGKAAQKTQKGL